MAISVKQKLNLLIVLIEGASLFGVAALATFMFSSDLTGLVQKDTLDATNQAANRAMSEINQLAEKFILLGATSLEDYKYDQDKIRFIQNQISFDNRIVGLSLYRVYIPQTTPILPVTLDTKAANQVDRGLANHSDLNPDIKAEWRIQSEKYEDRISSRDFVELERLGPINTEAVRKGRLEFSLAKLRNEIPIIRMAVPLVQQDEGVYTQFIVAELDQEKFAAFLLENTANTMLLVNRDGTVLGSSDPKTFSFASSIKENEIFHFLKNEDGDSGLSDFKDSKMGHILGAYRRVGSTDVTGLNLIGQASFARIDRQKHALHMRLIYLGFFFLSLALLVGFGFADGISTPIEYLARMARKVSKGDISDKITDSLKKEMTAGFGTDEINGLTHAFHDMITGLRERDRAKEVLVKFHSQDVAKELMRGDLKTRGERNFATILFSDIRSFTTLSEKTEPEMIVNILNEYMGVMVDVIHKHGGIIDKFIGDGILAVWGPPSNPPNGPDDAIMAALEMRRALIGLNKDFVAKNYPALQIGIGINSGPVVAGIIGSSQRMEYTVIGDTVNTATRIESLTKELQTDLLVSHEVIANCKKKYMIEDSDRYTVKGRSQSVNVFKVLGLVEANGEVEFGGEPPSRSARTTIIDAEEATLSGIALQKNLKN